MNEFIKISRLSIVVLSLFFSFNTLTVCEVLVFGNNYFEGFGFPKSEGDVIFPPRELKLEKFFKSISNDDVHPFPNDSFITQACSTFGNTIFIDNNDNLYSFGIENGGFLPSDSVEYPIKIMNNVKKEFGDVILECQHYYAILKGESGVYAFEKNNFYQFGFGVKKYNIPKRIVGNDYYKFFSGHENSAYVGKDKKTIFVIGSNMFKRTHFSMEMEEEHIKIFTNLNFNESVLINYEIEEMYLFRYGTFVVLNNNNDIYVYYWGDDDYINYLQLSESEKEFPIKILFLDPIKKINQINCKNRCFALVENEKGNDIIYQWNYGLNNEMRYYEIDYIDKESEKINFISQEDIPYGGYIYFISNHNRIYIDHVNQIDKWNICNGDFPCVLFENENFVSIQTQPFFVHHVVLNIQKNSNLPLKNEENVNDKENYVHLKVCEDSKDENETLKEEISNLKLKVNQLKEVYEEYYEEDSIIKRKKLEEEVLKSETE